MNTHKHTQPDNKNHINATCLNREDNMNAVSFRFFFSFCFWFCLYSEPRFCPFLWVFWICYAFVFYAFKKAVRTPKMESEWNGSERFCNKIILKPFENLLIHTIQSALRRQAFQSRNHFFVCCCCLRIFFSFVVFDF